jgi:hypothetical protein
MVMISLEKRKISFIERYLRIRNTTTLEKLEKILDEEIQREEFALTKEVTDLIDAGLNSLEAGGGLSHQLVISRLKQKYPTLQF